MDSTVTHFYLPVPDLKAARDFYRETVGLEEAWREGETTCAFKLPGTTIELMLDERKEGAPQKAGVVFCVPSTRAYYDENREKLNFVDEPFDIPGDSQWAIADDGSGHSVHIVDAP